MSSIAGSGPCRSSRKSSAAAAPGTRGISLSNLGGISFAQIVPGDQQEPVDGPKVFEECIVDHETSRPQDRIPESHYFRKTRTTPRTIAVDGRHVHSAIGEGWAAGEGRLADEGQPW